MQFYRAMKAMNPRVHICETEEASTAFLQVMGTTYPYDCVELHKYAKPLDLGAPMTTYEQNLMGAPLAEGAKLAQLQQEIRKYSGRNVPVVITEYGQLVRPMPFADPDFNLSLDEGLLVASQLRQWIVHGILPAEKYLLVSTPFIDDNPVDLSIDPVGLSINSAMIAGLAPFSVRGPTTELGQELGHLGIRSLAEVLVPGADRLHMGGLDAAESPRPPGGPIGPAAQGGPPGRRGRAAGGAAPGPRSAPPTWTPRWPNHHRPLSLTCR